MRLGEAQRIAIGALRAAWPALVRSAREAPASLLALVLASVLYLSLVLAQIASFALPIIVFEGHHWRQSFTYGVAWNFAHASLDVLHPRMFVELAQSNVVPMEAPLYPLLASVLLGIGGDSVVGPRVLSWLGLVATTLVLWRWLGEVEGQRGERGPGRAMPERAGLLVALGLAPMTAVDFRSIQPEPVAAGLAIASAFFFARHARTDRRTDLALGATSFGLSLLAKPLALGVAPSLVLFAVWGQRRPLRRGLGVALALSLAAAPWFAWDRWAHHMLRTALNGEWIIEIEHPPKAMLRMLLSGQFTAEALLRQLPNYATSWWLVPAVVAGLYRGLAERRWRRVAVPTLAWIVGYTIELLAVGIRLHSNAYYFILAAAPLALFAALGVGALVRVLDASRSRPPITTLRAGVACLVLLPLGWAASRASDWANTIDAAALGFERNRAVWSSDVGLGRMLLVFLVVFALAPLFRSRRVPPWVGVPVVVVIAALAVRPARDRDQFFRAYIGESRRAGFDDELRALRGAVDRHSSRSDRIIVSPGGTYREPPMYAFFYALRNGFSSHEDMTKADVEAMRARGARLYLRLDQVEKVHHPKIGGRVLATGAWWRLSCVAADDCP